MENNPVWPYERDKKSRSRIVVGTRKNMCKNPRNYFNVLVSIFLASKVFGYNKILRCLTGDPSTRTPQPWQRGKNASSTTFRGRQWSCNPSGRRRRRCGSRKLFHITDDISGRRFLVDTGASYSILPHSSAAEPKGPPLRSPGGQAIPCWGKKQLEFRFAGQKLVWTFLFSKGWFCNFAEPQDKVQICSRATCGDRRTATVQQSLSF